MDVSWFSEVGKWALTLGPIGIMIISFIGNAIPYSVIPYLIFVVNYAAVIGGRIDVLVVTAILGGLGATLGKLVVYSVGRIARVALSKEAKQNLELFTTLASKSVFVATFLFAALPLPDDILYVPLGVTGYSIFKFFIAVALGKIVITGMALTLGSMIQATSSITGSADPLLSTVIALLVSIILSYIILSIDWAKVINDVKSEGWLKFIRKLVRQPRAYFRS